MKKICIVILFLLFNISVIKSQEIQNQNGLSIEQAIERALQYNPEIKKGIENINGIKGKKLSEISLEQPEISLSYEFIPTGRGLGNYEERTFEVSQSFDFPYDYFLKSSKYDIETSILSHELRSIKQKVISNVRSSYYKILANEEKLKIINENISITKEFYRTSEIRFNVGEGTYIEVLTAKVQLSEAEKNVEIVKNELENSHRELNYAMGIPDHNYNISFNLINKLEYIQSDVTLDALIKKVSSINPEIKKSELQVNSKSIQKTLAWTSLLPKFNLGYLRQSSQFNSNFYGVSFGFTMPLWFFLDQNGRIKESNAEFNFAKEELRSTKNDVYLKLYNLYNDLKNKEKVVKFYQNEILPQSEEVMMTALKSYTAGEISYVEFLQASQTLITSKINYIETLTDYILTMISIEEITGFKK